MCQFDGDLRGLMRRFFELGRDFERLHGGSLDANLEFAAAVAAPNVVVLDARRAGRQPRLEA